MSTTLDLAEFEKLRALFAGPPSPGQGVARFRARMLARAAGMSMEEAIARADRAKVAGLSPAQADPGLHNSLQTPSTPLHALAATLDTPEARAFAAKRQEARQARLRELLEEHGSEEAILAETERERALRIACEPLIAERPIIGGFSETLSGWDGPGGSMPAEVRSTVAAAFPLPATVADLWAEHRFWDELADRRAVVSPDYDHPLHVRARVHVIEAELDTMPATSFADVKARLSWMERLNDYEVGRDVREEAKLLATLRADIERLAVQSEQAASSPGAAASAAGAQLGQLTNVASLRTTRDRRETVLAMLSDPSTADLPDREIARRAGVAPQTVGNWRRRAVADRSGATG